MNGKEKQTRCKKRNKDALKKKTDFSNISSLLLIKCFSLRCFHHAADVLLLFSFVHSSINNSNQENTQHLSWLYPLPSFFVINSICSQSSGE